MLDPHRVGVNTCPYVPVFLTNTINESVLRKKKNFFFFFLNLCKQKDVMITVIILR